MFDLLKYFRFLRIALRSMILLLPMLGVAWLIGFVANVNIIGVYIFDLFAAVQVRLLTVGTLLAAFRVQSSRFISLHLATLYRVRFLDSLCCSSLHIMCMMNERRNDA